MPSLRTDDGRTLSWREVGSGPPLFCHPGGPGCSSLYYGELPELAAERTLVMLDPRGTGGSSRPALPSAYELEDYAADIEAVRGHLGADRLDLLGHSHGGFVAVEYAATHPERVRRLVLAATAARFAPEYAAAVDAVWEEHSDPTVSPAREARAQRLSAHELPPDEFVRLAMIELRLFFARADGVPVMGRVFEREPPNLAALAYFNRETAAQFDLRPLLPAISAQTLIVSGDHDFFGKLAADELLAGIDDAHSVVLREAGHFLWIDQPEAFAGEVRAFLLQ